MTILFTIKKKEKKSRNLIPTFSREKVTRVIILLLVSHDSGKIQWKQKKEKKPHVFAYVSTYTRRDLWRWQWVPCAGYPHFRLLQPRRGLCRNKADCRSCQLFQYGWISSLEQTKERNVTFVDLPSLLASHRDIKVPEYRLRCDPSPEKVQPFYSPTLYTYIYINGKFISVSIRFTFGLINGKREEECVRM